MRLFAEIITYNEEVYIEASIKNILPYVEKIIVVDGSLWGPSTDRTVDIARSCGPKVEVISGTWRDPRENERDHKWPQRRAGLLLMPRGEDCWCMVHDADEGWLKEEIEQLVSIIEGADRKILGLTYYARHFWLNPWHEIKGGIWDEGRLRVFRLFNDSVDFISHYKVKIKADEEEVVLTNVPEREGHLDCPDVRFYHYGWCIDYEKWAFKKKFYFLRGNQESGGITIEEYMKTLPELWAGQTINVPNVFPYPGPHPKEFEDLFGKLVKSGYWKMT